MNQRPSLVWLMDGEWLASPPRRLVIRQIGTRRITQCMMSSSGFFDTAWCAAPHILPLAAAMTVDQCRDDAGGELFAGDVVGVPDLRCDRRRVVFRLGSDQPQFIMSPAESEMDQVGALQVLPGLSSPNGVGAPARESALSPYRPIRACSAHRSLRRAARPLSSRQQVLARGRLAQIEHHRLLAAVIPEEQRALQSR
jgi:hypothetical protein